MATSAKRIARQVGEIQQRIECQLAAIEAGVDPVEVGRRIRELKAERAEAQSALTQIEDSQRDSTAVDPRTPERYSTLYPTSASDSQPRTLTYAAPCSTLPPTGRDRPQQWSDMPESAGVERVRRGEESK
jgi:hypothetical protein